MEYLPLTAIRAFEAAARHQSFSAAGEELHVTHAAISHQIKRIEEWLGVPLFRREARGVRVTEEGSLLLVAASAALDDLARACRRIRISATTPMLSVGCIPSIATRWLVPRLPGFTAAHPGIEIKVVYARAEERFGGDNDVLITMGADPSAKVVSRKLFSRTSRPVCSPHYSKATKLDTPRQIARADLLHDETRSGWQLWFDEAGLRAADVGNGPIFADFNMLATAVIAGHGVALCPVEVFRDELRRGDLVVLSEIATDQDKGYYLTMSEHAKPAARTFADWFSAEISRDAPATSA